MKNCTLLFFPLIFFFKPHAQKIATMEVDLSRSMHGLAVPASVALDRISFSSDSSLMLVEVDGNKRTPVPFQISQGQERILYWVVQPGTASGAKKRIFELQKGAAPGFNKMKADMKDGALTISVENRNLLRYWYTTVYPPAGVDSSFKRSGFIHPLWTPNGQELTRIQAPDHYHHYGIWNPWTHVLFEGDTVDFWNIRGEKRNCAIWEICCSYKRPSLF